MTPTATTRTPASDGALIGASVSQPEEFASIFDRHFGVVHRYLSRRLGRERADDVAAQTFTVAFERRTSFRFGEPDARPWLLGIATNLMRSEWRSEQRLLETVAQLGAQTPGSYPDHAASRADHDPELAAALARLDGDQRDVLFLYAWFELSYEEIAAALAIPVGTVRSRLSRARGQLRIDLAPPEATLVRKEIR